MSGTTSAYNDKEAGKSDIVGVRKYMYQKYQDSVVYRAGYTYPAYEAYAAILCLSMMIMGMCMINLRGIDFNRKVSRSFFQMTWKEAENTLQPVEVETFPEQEETSRFLKIWKSTSSPERAVHYDILVNEKAVYLEESDYDILCRIVEAEAGNEDETGRMLVAGVVLNRVESSRFPNTVKGVVFQKSGGTSQFSPISNGSYFRVSVSNATREAVEKVLAGENISQGALFFVNRKAAKPEYMQWFDTKCTPLFSYGGHEFFS